MGVDSGASAVSVFAMKLLLASSEIHPFSKTGGLADMVGALAKALARAGHEVSAVTPLYAGVREKFPDIKTAEVKLDLPMGAHSRQGKVSSLPLMDNLTVY